MKNIFLHKSESTVNQIPEQRDKEITYAEKLNRIARLDSLKNKKSLKSLKSQVFFLVIANLLIFFLLLLIYLVF